MDRAIYVEDRLFNKQNTNCVDCFDCTEHSIVPAGSKYIGALTQAADRFLLASDSYNYLGYKTAERKTISRPHFSSPQTLFTSSSCSYLGVI